MGTWLHWLLAVGWLFFAQENLLFAQEMLRFAHSLQWPVLYYVFFHCHV